MESSVILGAVLFGLAVLLVGIGHLIHEYTKHTNRAHVKAEKARIEEFKNTIKRIVNPHLKTLAIKNAQMVRQDDYGNYLFDEWHKEIHYFLNSVVAKAYNLKPTEYYTVFELITDLVYAYKTNEIEKGRDVSFYTKDMSPLDFEHFCAERLRAAGWNAKVTSASGDQGVDIVATHGDIKAVFQCKKYSQPVGNSAVQEIIAGKQFEQANVAAVISNSSFTNSARQLASAADVYLLHCSELEQFAKNFNI